MPDTLPSAAEDGPAKQPRLSWGTVTTLTPVVLTLLSTLLAGLSSSEMTRAQYYRSLAAQYQSKAGDQWSFFQAKRIRETIIGVDLDLHPEKPMKVEPARLLSSLEALANEMEDARKQCGQLVKAIEAAPAAASKDDRPTQTLRPLIATLQERTAEAKPILDRIRDAFQRQEVATALSFLGTERLPAPATADKPLGDQEIQAALKGIEERRTERELAALVAAIDETDLQKAVENAETNAKGFEDAAKGVDRALEKIDKAVNDLTRAAYQSQRGLEEIETALDGRSSDKDKAGRVWTEQHPASSNGVAIGKKMQRLKDYQVARKDYTARRNEREARYNQRAAGPYELRVAKSGVTSDRHRTRSQRFFFGMLCAQAGAAIGSLAVAARQKSGLWSLAGLAGIIAVGFSVYVYLYV